MGEEADDRYNQLTRLLHYGGRIASNYASTADRHMKVTTSNKPHTCVVLPAVQSNTKAVGSKFKIEHCHMAQLCSKNSETKL